MGYTTQFQGELKFSQEITLKQVADLSKMFGEDGRDHPQWKSNPYYLKDWNFIDLDFNEDFSGIRWSEAEKSYGMVNQVNFILFEAKKLQPDIGLTGEFFAQGEDVGDVWKLKIGKDGWAYAEEVPLDGKIIECPHCGEKFKIP